MQMVIVMGIIGVMAGISLPYLNATVSRFRAAGLPREIVTNLRQTRQQAMSQRQSYMFRYTDTTKIITLIDRQERGLTTTVPDVTWRTVPLASGGILASDVKYGLPSGSSASTTLPDGVTMTSLTANVAEVTFQPDGTVIDANGNPVNFGFFFYHNRLASETTCAISVLGASGRIKLWRYDGNANQWIEQ